MKQKQQREIDLFFKGFKKGKRITFFKKLKTFFKINYSNNKVTACQEISEIVNSSTSILKLKKVKKRNIITFFPVYNAGGRKQVMFSVKLFLKALSKKVGIVLALSKATSQSHFVKKNAWKKNLYKTANNLFNY